LIFVILPPAAETRPARSCLSNQDFREPIRRRNCNLLPFLFRLRNACGGTVVQH
jgi:hypothetical protein